MSRKITEGISKPVALLEFFGIMYVANYGNDSITIYPPGSSTPAIAISTGISGPQALAATP